MMPKYKLTALIGVILNSIVVVFAFFFDFLSMIKDQQFLNNINEQIAALGGNETNMTITFDIQSMILVTFTIISLVLCLVSWIAFSRLSQKNSFGWEIYLLILSLFSFLSGFGNLIGVFMGGNKLIYEDILLSFLKISCSIFLILSFIFWKIHYDEKKIKTMNKNEL